jgi:3-deoxy-D-manno-octulosonate 8-phosphate phosphatase (KDO 8-P phosphatase)
LVSGEDGSTLDQIARKFGIADVYGGCRDKAEALRAFAARHSLTLDQICFMGDDVNDVPALSIAGVAAVPATAHYAARAVAEMTATRRGGEGAVREVIDAILGSQI